MRLLPPALTAVILIAVAAAQSDKKTQVKINYLNVCTPSVEEQKELSGALARIPAHPRFSEDFEVSRARTSLTEPPIKLAGGETEDAPAAAGGTTTWVG